MGAGILSGSRILVVEDEYYLADDARVALAEVGAEVVGPVPTVGEAAALLEAEAAIDGVLLDVNLRGEMAFAVADTLQARGVPFIFVTGYDRAALPERFAAVPILGKPLDSAHLVTLFGRLKAASQDLA